MADNTGIEWTDATWNPITGCWVISPGCTNCYAMKLAGTRLKHHPSRAGLTMATKSGPVWNGEARFNQNWLGDPLRWRRPRRIFVCAHGDLFYEAIPDEWIDKVFAVMALAPQHTFQVLTKRASRMLSYMSDPELSERVSSAAARISSDFGKSCDIWDSVKRGPLPNVWLGVSAERQEEADERIPLLLNTPAAVRFISAEPLIGPLDLDRVRFTTTSGKSTYQASALTWADDQPRIDWVIVGGESQDGARPMRPEWARSLRDQCEAAGVPFFFKQWGEWAYDERVGQKLMRGDDQPHAIDELFSMIRVGKKAAGKTLDGLIWRQFPQTPDQAGSQISTAK